MNKKIKIVLLILILILLILIIRSTYSKYSSESEANISKEIADWVIKVNDTDITINETQNDDSAETEEKKQNVTFEITGDDIVWESNSKVSTGKAAPGTKGYFFLRIDPKGTQTAFKYTINVDISDILEGHIDFKINDITEESGKELHFQRLGNKDSIVNIQRVKELDEIKSSNDSQRIDKIKVELEWVDKEKDRFDTKIGEVIDNVFKIPVTVNAIQYTGEGYDF